jgi:hypothetical protein
MRRTWIWKEGNSGKARRQSPVAREKLETIDP